MNEEGFEAECADGDGRVEELKGAEAEAEEVVGGFEI